MNNIKKVSAALKNAEFDAVLVTSPENRRYTTGFESTDGYVIVTDSSAAFFVDGRYSELAAEKITDAEIILISRAADAYAYMNDYIEKHGIKRLGVEGGKLSNSSYLRLKEKLKADFINAQQFFADLRKVKSREELDIMIKAQRIAEKSYLETAGAIHLGMTEKDLAAELFCRMIKNGADDRSFETIVVSGAHSSMPHGQAEDRPLQKGFLTIDFGCKYEGYCSDTTRTLCIGEPDGEMIKVYDTVLKAQETAIAAAKNGITGKALDAAARDVIKAAGYGEYFVHALSHGVGLEIHEQPNASPQSSDTIITGNVISVEPGIYIPGKYGVRIEDVIYITDNGMENLTSLNKELAVIC